MFALSIPLILSTFGIIFVAELPDKTSLAALVLATKYKALDVIAGVWLALLIQTIVAVLVGGIFTFLPTQPVRIAAGIGFLVFAVLAYRRKEDEVEKEEEDEVAHAKKRRPAWLISFLIIFAAEWGDLTQLATVALVAQNGHPLSIGIGAILALWAVTIIAVVSGSQLSRFFNPKTLNLISALLFGAVGIFIIVSAFVATPF